MASTCSWATAVEVEPAPLGRGAHHGVLAGDVIGGQRHVEGPPGCRDHIQEGQRRLHHHHVGALGHIEADLLYGLPGTGHVLLVGAAVAAARDGHVHRVAEGPVQGGGVLGRVGEDGGLLEAAAVEGGADGAHLPVHHPRRGHDVSAGGGLGQSDAGVDLEGGVVVHAAAAVEHAAVPVVGVLVHAQIRDQHHLVTEIGAQIGQRRLHDAVGIPRF